MVLDDFYSEFLVNYDKRNLSGSSAAVMKSMGELLITKRQDFIDLLSDSGMQGDFANLSDTELVDAYVESLPDNKMLKLGSSVLVNINTQQGNQAGFDGQKSLSDAGVKSMYHTLCVYFPSPSENYSNAAGAIAGAVSEVSKLGSKIIDNKQKNKFSVADMANKKMDAKAAMTQHILEQRKTQMAAAEAKQVQRAKTTRTVLIASTVVVGLGVIGLIVYKVIKK